MPVVTIPTYCSQADVKRLFSATGVNARLDDVCELQKVAITGTPTGGTYTLTYAAVTTPAIAYNADQIAVQAAIREIDALAEADVATTGTTPNFIHRVKFISVTGDAALMTATSSLSGGTPVITITEVQMGSSAALDDAIIRACEEINKYCYKFYSPANLGTSNLVQQWAIELACYYLSQRRGNPELFAKLYENAIEELKMVLKGEMELPGVPFRRTLSPKWSNIRADILRYRFRVLRVERGTSDQRATTQGQDVDYAEQYSYEN
jgi:phage gp36-like protein